MQTAGRKIGGDRNNRQQAANGFAGSPNHIQNPRNGDNLAGKNRQTTKPEKQRRGYPDCLVVSMFQIIADSVEVLIAGDLPYLWADCSRQNQGADTGRTNPPPGGI